VAVAAAGVRRAMAETLPADTRVVLTTLPAYLPAAAAEAEAAEVAEADVAAAETAGAAGVEEDR
jgi:hypothetical protein